MFATDYPHWDFDAPDEALPKVKLPDGFAAKLMAENARALYKLPTASRAADGRSTSSATVDEIPPGGRKIVEVAGRTIGVFNVDGEFFALLNRCPHQGGPLCTGNTLGLSALGRRRRVPATAARARCCAAPGTAGSTTCGPASPGSTRQRPGAALRGDGRAGPGAAEGAVRGRDVPGARRAGIRRGRDRPLATPAPARSRSLLRSACWRAARPRAFIGSSDHGRWPPPADEKYVRLVRGRSWYGRWLFSRSGLSWCRESEPQA